MKLLAVDGNSILNRAYYGIRLLSTKDGRFTNGIYGFLTILLRMCEETNPDAVAITFDTRKPTFRHKQYDGYKAQRKGMPDELAQQMPPLKELLGYLGYQCIELDGYEADDLLGTLSAACCAAGNDCVIATGDRDSFQLIGDCVTVRLASTKGGRPVAEFYDVPAVEEKYGVTPKQLIDVKALMGDPSDNVPGVKGIGEKGATNLIKEFGSLEAIYNELDTLPIRDNMREKLRAGKEMAFLSKMLVTIDKQAPIDTEIERFRLEQPDNDAAYALMADLELFSLIDRFSLVAPSATNVMVDSVQAPAELEIAFNSLPKELLSGSKPIDVLFEFSSDKHDSIEAFCVITPDLLYVVDTDLEKSMQAVLTSSVPKRTNNIKLLHRYAFAHNFTAENIIFDAEIAGYILNPTATTYTIERLSAEYAVMPLSLNNLLGMRTALLEDCAVFTALADVLTEKLKENEQSSLFSDIELPLARVLASMEHIGFSIDLEGLQQYGEEIDLQIEQHQQKIYELAGETFNINSPKQLGVILFEKLGLPTRKKTKTGYSTSAEVLESLADKHSIVQEILEYRTVAKLKSTYVDGLMRVVGEDGRIHTSFQQTLTRTGRISSTEPNLQNIPIRTPLGSELRRFFRSKEGCRLLDADYSQIELRVLAHIAKDENMIDAFVNGEDIHTNTAAQVFDMPPLFITPLMRSRAKAVNFGIVYGIGAFSLSKDIGVSVSEADQYIKNYLATYSGVRNYMQDTIAYGKEHGYVKTLYGRRRNLPELASSNYNMREFGKRVAMNMPIQGTAADIIKIAMVRVYDRLNRENLQAKLILQVHDELIVECPEEEVEHASIILREEMEHAAALAVPLDVDIGSGSNWLDAK